jgi:hypothetical protein
MSDPSIQRDLYERAMMIGHEAYGQECFEAAHYAFLSALDCACDLPEDELLEAIALAAASQAKETSQIRPEALTSRTMDNVHSHETNLAQVIKQVEKMLTDRRTKRG